MLLDRDDCVLVAIDVQPAFYSGLEQDDERRAETVLARIRWLVAVAAAFQLPVVVTEEEPERQGSTHGPTAAALPAGTRTFLKPTFGLAGTPQILEAVWASGRGTAVLIGFETDVCVAQSAIGLRTVGMRVVVVDDATFSPGEMHERGLRRLAGTGVERNHAKGVAYEWARTVRDGEILAAVSDPPFRL